MIQPRSYPELLAKALVLEPEPFAVMTHDDQPIIEGLVLTALIGVLVGVARVVGGLLFSWAVPPAAALEAVARQAAGLLALGDSLISRAVVGGWQIVRFMAGYDTGWVRLFSLVWEPFLLLAQWLIAGLLIYAIGRMVGGKGTLRQLLGASALVVAPSALLLITVIPFVAINPLLLAVWGALILYRAAQTAHLLPWKTAAVATIITVALMLVIGALVAVGAGALVALP